MCWKKNAWLIRFAVRESGMIALPSERTLYDYTHWVKPHTGVQYEFVERLKSQLSGLITLLWVWMSMEIEYGDFKNELVFNKHTGSLTGFVDLGSANEDIERWFSNTYGQETRHSSSWLDHYFSASLSGTDMYTHSYIYWHIVSPYRAQLFSSAEKIFPMAWEVIEALELYDVPLTSDGAQQILPALST